MYSKIDGPQWVLSRIHAIYVTKNWSLSDPDPKLIIQDPANNFGFPDPQHCFKVVGTYFLKHLTIKIILVKQIMKISLLT